jgi:hypothetical protein
MPTTVHGDSFSFGGEIHQGVSAKVHIDSTPSVIPGATTSLQFRFRADNESVTVRAGGKISLLYGNDAENLWVFIGLDPTKSFGSIMNPSYSLVASVPEFITLLSITELSFSWSEASLVFEAGLSKTNWGLGQAFSPSDFFADFDYSSGRPERKPSLLAKVSWFPSSTTRVDFVARPPFGEGATIASRLYGLIAGTLAGGVSLGVRSAWDANPIRLLTACEIVFDLPYVTPYGECSVVIPLEGIVQPYISTLAGMTASLGKLVIIGEYLYAQSEQVQHKIFGLASLSIDDWTSVSIPVFFFPETASFSSGIGLTLSDVGGITISLSGSLTRSPLDSWAGTMGIALSTAF